MQLLTSAGLEGPGVEKSQKDRHLNCFNVSVKLGLMLLCTIIVQKDAKWNFKTTCFCYKVTLKSITFLGNSRFVVECQGKYMGKSCLKFSGESHQNFIFRIALKLTSKYGVNFKIICLSFSILPKQDN